MLNHINCPICNSKLSKPESIVAGIGPVCHRRLKFAENANNDELRTMATKREYPKTAIKNNKVLILKKNHEEKYLLAQILNHQKEYFLFLNLSNIRKEYDSNRDIVQAYLKSFEIKKHDEFEFVSDVNQPDNPDFLIKFRHFNKEYNDELLEQNYIDKSFQELGLSAYYVKINNKEDMTIAQKNNRDGMAMLREKDPTIYNQMWSSGSFQRATLLYRMKNLKNKEAKSFANFLESNPTYYSVQSKDWGLTDDEIVNGLKHSIQKIESYLFMAYLMGNKNFTLMLALSNKIPEMSKENRFIAYQALIKMLSNQRFNKDDLKKEFK